jgi:hypothetical protein
MRFYASWMWRPARKWAKPSTVPEREIHPGYRMAARSFYNRFQKLGPKSGPTDRELNSRVYLHVIGTDPDKDPMVFGSGLAESRLSLQISLSSAQTQAVRM